MYVIVLLQTIVYYITVTASAVVTSIVITYSLDLAHNKPHRRAGLKLQVWPYSSDFTLGMVLKWQPAIDSNK